jgi:hypothetical protein
MDSSAQTTPQPPQLYGSVCSLTQTNPQAVCPPEQGTQVPPVGELQANPSAHPIPGLEQSSARGAQGPPGPLGTLTAQPELTPAAKPELTPLTTPEAAMLLPLPTLISMLPPPLPPDDVVAPAAPLEPPS